MNLVAKEFVAARADQGGALKVSRFTGAVVRIGRRLQSHLHSGADFFPQTPEGRLLSLLLAVYAFAIWGYADSHDCHTLFGWHEAAKGSYWS